MPPRPLWPLKNSQSASPAARAMALTPLGDLGLRQPEYFRIATDPLRPYGGKRLHGDGSALGLGVGLGVDHGDAGGIVVLTIHVERSFRRLMRPFLYIQLK